MYPLTLALHSLLRWVVLIAGIVAFARAVAGMRGRREWTPADSRAGQVFVGVLDLQFLLGIILYLFLSPITRVAFGDFGAAMANSVLRFWAVEHVFGMVAALALAHIGRTRVRKTSDAARRHKLAAIFFGLALAAMLATIPWPGTPSERPLLRGF
jgi:phosphate/sulfate permease